MTKWKERQRKNQKSGKEIVLEHKFYAITVLLTFDAYFFLFAMAIAFMLPICVSILHCIHVYFMPKTIKYIITGEIIGQNRIQNTITFIFVRNTVDGACVREFCFVFFITWLVQIYFHLARTRFRHRIARFRISKMRTEIKNYFHCFGDIFRKFFIKFQEKNQISQLIRNFSIFYRLRKIVFYCIFVRIPT